MPNKRMKFSIKVIAEISQLVFLFSLITIALIN